MTKYIANTSEKYMKLVIQTQYKENYAAHDDTYVAGVSEDYWKFKGGETIVIHDLTTEQVAASGFWDQLYSCIESSDNYQQEYILSDDLIDDRDFDESKHIEHWETVCNATVVNGNLHCVKQQKSFTDDSGRIVAERTWVQTPTQKYLDATYKQFEQVA
jgi:hypothetical protein